MDTKDIEDGLAKDNICREIAQEMNEKYVQLREHHPMSIVLAGMAGALVACAQVENVPLETLIEIVTLTFDSMKDK